MEGGHPYHLKIAFKEVLKQGRERLKKASDVLKKKDVHREDDVRELISKIDFDLREIEQEYARIHALIPDETGEDGKVAFPKNKINLQNGLNYLQHCMEDMVHEGSAIKDITNQVREAILQEAKNESTAHRCPLDSDMVLKNWEQAPERPIEQLAEWVERLDIKQTLHQNYIALILADMEQAEQHSR